MISIKVATPQDFPTIRQIAHTTWPPTFGNILSKEQIAYMLEMMYSISSLDEQVTSKKHTFLLAQENGKYLGFASFEKDYQGLSKTKIHKIYILPEAQGKGVGKALLNRIAEVAVANNNQVLSLNVNRFNPAIAVYEKLGFTTIGQEDINIGNGFLMEDFVMEKRL